MHSNQFCQIGKGYIQREGILLHLPTTTEFEPEEAWGARASRAARGHTYLAGLESDAGNRGRMFDWFLVATPETVQLVRISEEQ
jgi:hypothetical protein